MTIAQFQALLFRMAAPETSPLRRDVVDGVAVLTFDRPDQANTWSADLHVAYLDALDELAVATDVRAVVVTGAGRHFCAGADVSLLDAISSGGEIPEVLDGDSFLRPLSFPKPLIAAVNGSAAGIGLLHALMCDIRFAAERAVFTTAFTRRGLVAEHGASWLLPQIVGRAHALDLLLSARRVPADEALRMGLVHGVCAPEELLDRAVAYARDLADNCSPAAMSVVKHQVTHHAVQTLEQSESETARLVTDSLTGQDFDEGVRSFIEKRPAQFPPLGSGTSFPSLAPPPVDPDRVAEEFFRATASNDWPAALRLLSPQARLATHPGPPESGVEGLAEGWQRLRRAFGPWEYREPRRLTTARSFCEQHVVHFPDLDLELEVCVVAQLDESGLITRLDEYADGHALREALQRHTRETAAATA